jgi:hypothetical protein
MMGIFVEFLFHLNSKCDMMGISVVCLSFSSFHKRYSIFP